MSRQIVFKINTSVSLGQVKEVVSKIWHGEYVDVFWSAKEEENRNSSLCCDIAYIYGRPDEHAQVAQVAEYLFSIADGDEVIYYRCRDTMNDTQLYEREIKIKEIMEGEFQPGMYDGTQYRYMLTLK